jgi:lipopolysaccharide transport system permease protein
MFQFFAEVVTRAPNLVLENPSYVKKIIFPLDILVPSAMLTALFAAVVNTAIFLAGYLLLRGLPPPSAIALLAIWPALLLFVAGVAWMLSALGVYFRDLGQLAVTVVPALMFVTPIFYPSQAVPEGARLLLMANPLSWFVEAGRGALFDGTWPRAELLTALAWAGRRFFALARRGFADVV